MVGFYASIMFIGIVLILVSLVWIAFDKKKTFDDEKRMDDKREELTKIISDADLMVEELNKFSDYIVSLVDQKNLEALDAIKNLEEKVKSIAEEKSVVLKGRAFEAERVASGSQFVLSAQSASSFINGTCDLIIDNIMHEETSSVKSSRSKPQGKIKEKVIPINSKHKEVITLAQKGLDETEIAKKLSMGKGEIQLILGVNR